MALNSEEIPLKNELFIFKRIIADFSGNKYI